MFECDTSMCSSSALENTRGESLRLCEVFVLMIDLKVLSPPVPQHTIDKNQVPVVWFLDGTPQSLKATGPCGVLAI